MASFTITAKRTTVEDVRFIVEAPNMVAAENLAHTTWDDGTADWTLLNDHETFALTRIDKIDALTRIERS